MVQIFSQLAFKERILIADVSPTHPPTQHLILPTPVVSIDLLNQVPLHTSLILLI